MRSFAIEEPSYPVPALYATLGPSVSNDRVTPLGIFPSHVQSGKAIVSGLSQSNADGAFDKIPP